MVPGKRIGIAVKGQQPGLASLLRTVLETLRDRGIDVVVETEGAELLSEGEAAAGSRSEVLEGADLVVVLGGDGTTLAVVRAIGSRDIPVLGINLGQLGFLTDVAPDEARSALERVLDGEFEILERSRLEVRHLNLSGDPELILNDAVFTKGTALARMIELRATVDGACIGTYRSDGLIVSTPTGATAYNLSAGGPLVDPDLNAMILTPICPHTLSHRPFVLPDDRGVEVELCSQEEALVTLDGQVGLPLCPGDRVRIGRSPHPARFVVVTGHDPFETLRTKLGWGTR
jgi:NAD+ kinase